MRATFDDEGLQEIVAALVLDLPRQQREIALAIEQRQSAPLIRQAHTMRGNCEMFGALQLAALEHQVRSGDATRTPACPIHSWTP